jgi:hypothetical protein
METFVFKDALTVVDAGTLLLMARNAILHRLLMELSTRVTTSISIDLLQWEEFASLYRMAASTAFQLALDVSSSKLISVPDMVQYLTHSLDGLQCPESLLKNCPCVSTSTLI